MATDNQDQAIEQDQDKTEDQVNQQGQQPTNDSIEERLAAVEARYKKELKGLNSKVSTLEKEKENLELEKLSDVERVEAEKRKAIEEAEEIKRETAGLRRERDLTKVLFDTGLDPALYGSRLVGDTIDEMRADAEKLQQDINKAVEAGIEKEVTRRLGGSNPEPGKAAAPLSHEEAVDRARKLSSGRRY